MGQYVAGMLKPEKPINKSEEIKIDKIASLQLQPDDVLVLSYGGTVSDKTFDRLKTILERIAPGHKTLILENGMMLQVLKPSLKWTKELPTKEGIYWCRDNQGKDPIFMAEVVNEGGWVAYEFGCEIYFSVFEAYEWYGPIEPPEYP
jgi:hypothetical protein